ncbi:unnamed protein product, partial [Discosporangium mesarthrocarpum]
MDKVFNTSNKEDGMGNDRRWTSCSSVADMLSLSQGPENQSSKVGQTLSQCVRDHYRKFPELDPQPPRTHDRVFAGDKAVGYADDTCNRGSAMAGQWSPLSSGFCPKIPCFGPARHPSGQPTKAPEGPGETLTFGKMRVHDGKSWGPWQLLKMQVLGSREGAPQGNGGNICGNFGGGGSSQWEAVRPKPKVIDLCRGGQLRFWPQFLGEGRRRDMVQPSSGAQSPCSPWRQWVWL